MVIYILLLSVFAGICFATGDTGCSVEYNDEGAPTLSFQLDWRPPAGPAGRPGKRGSAGPPGPTGIQGIEGPVGPKGNAGEKGSIGPIGPKGNAGERGSIGRIGRKGDAGEKGSIGPIGLKGSLGPPGPIPEQKLAELNNQLLKINRTLTALVSVEKVKFISGTQYAFGSRPMTWQDSRIYCQSIGADLAAKGIRILQTYNDIAKIVAEIGSNHWIGLTDLVSEGRYIFVDGVSCSASAFFWDSTEPNNSGDCAVMHTNDKKVYDRECSTEYRPICEF